ncbi:hypothetical protein GGI08_003952, partial [Coemansia sp. S2]
EQLESRIGLTRVARRQHAVESGHGLVDSLRSDTVVAVPVVAGKRAAVTTTDRNAIKEFERIAATSTSVGESVEQDSGSSDKEASDDFRQDLLAPATRGRRPTKTVSALGKRPRAKQIAKPVSESSSDGDDFVSPTSSAPQITRPSRNVRTTLALASTASRASASVSDDDIEDSEDASLPSSIVSPPAKRGRGATKTAAASKRGATGRGRGRGRGASQRTVSLLASQMPAVAIDDDDDDASVTNSRGFGGFSLRKRT